MTRSTSTQAQLSREQIQAIIDTLKLACKMLLALEPILKSVEKKLPK